MHTGFFSLSSEPRLSHLYQLHPRPSMAETDGHVSMFSFHTLANFSKTSMTEVWQEKYKTYAYAPGT